MAIRGDGRVSPLAVAIPLVLSIVGFVLTMIALFAGTGSQQQALETYHVVAINMSNFGHDLIPSPTNNEPSQPTETDDGGFFDDIQDGLSDIGDQIVEELGDIADDAADRLAEALGISQWYSLHVMNTCEGDFAPNATTIGAWFNTTNCTAQRPGTAFNLTEILNREIEAGPLDINPADLPLPDAVVDAVDYLNGFLLAIFIIYVLAAGFSGISILTCIVALALRGSSIGRGTSLINILVAGLATLTLAIGAAISTAVAKKGVDEINKAGEDVGISGIEGTKFMTISWVAFAVMFVTLLFWTVTCCLPRRRRGNSANYVEKGPRSSYDSHRGLMSMFRRRH